MEYKVKQRNAAYMEDLLRPSSNSVRKDSRFGSRERHMGIRELHTPNNLSRQPVKFSLG